MLNTLDALPKPTIAVLHGGCLGGGVGLAACCDIALAQEDAFFAIPEVRLGLTPTSLLPIFLRAIEYRAFRRYGLSGERFSAAEAMRVGLVHQVCPAEALEATVATVVEELLHSAPGAVASLKKSAARLVAQPLAVEAAAAGPRSPETAEGIAAFLEKRKPSWYPKP
jgi:methylglutaconyl-CoA hydratase